MFAHECLDLFFVVAHVECFDDEGFDAFAEDAFAYGFGVGGDFCGDECSCAAFFVDESFGFEFAVGADDGVGVEDELLCELAYGGEFGVGFESSGGDEGFDLVDELRVYGGAVAL